ncbi:MAG: orotate phosphoribosyltransferase [bacterium]
MKQQAILEIFQKARALLNGHFRLTSGLHSQQYFQCAKVLQYPEYAERLCGEIGKHFEGEAVSAVVAPAIGGIVVAHEVARALGVRALFSERESGQMALRRGFAIENGERILVVEDVVTTGGSVQEVLELVKSRAGIPVGVGCLVDRSSGNVDFGGPFFSLIRLNIQAWPADRCALCQRGVPLVKPGSRSAASDG